MNCGLGLSLQTPSFAQDPVTAFETPARHSQDLERDEPTGLRRIGERDMMKLGITKAVLFLSLAVALPVSGQEGSNGTAATDETFAEALLLARTNLTTAEEKRYDASHAGYYGPTMGSCVEAAKKPDLSSFQLLLKLGADGRVTKAVVGPETNLSLCFRDKLEGSIRPKPPRPDYWVLVEMSLSQREPAAPKATLPPRARWLSLRGALFRR